MFDEGKWYELLSKLAGLGVIYTPTQHQKNLVRVDSRITAATKKSGFGKFEEIPLELFEKVYNTLQSRGTLSQQQISRELNVKRSAFIMAALRLLPEIAYDEAGNSLKWKATVKGFDESNP